MLLYLIYSLVSLSLLLKKNLMYLFRFLLRLLLKLPLLFLFAGEMVPVVPRTELKLQVPSIHLIQSAEARRMPNHPRRCAGK